MTFLAQLSALLASRAARVVRGDPEFASIDLAAHLYAAAIYLREQYPDARMDTGAPVLAYDLQEAIELADRISASDAAMAYLEICGALLGIDKHFDNDRTVTASVVPHATQLQTLHDGDRAALTCTVRHWIKPPSSWTDARDHREAELPWVNVYPLTPGEQLRALGMMWDREEPIGIRPVRRRDLPVRARAAGFRIALCPLVGAGHPRFAINAAGDQFTIDATAPHSNPARLAARVTELAALLEAAEVQLAVLPELSVPEVARHQLARVLDASRSLVGIVAGSFHIWRDGHELPFNEAAFCVPGGVAWAHDKAGYFRVTDRDVAALGAWFAQPLPPLQASITEGIRRGRSLQFWDTRIGRIAMLICADAIAKESMIGAVERCRPDLLLLPSMSLKTESFEQVADRLAGHGISVLYVNAGSVNEHATAALGAFARIALPEPPGAPFTRVRWTPGRTPQAFDRRAARAQDRWIAAPPEQIQVLGNQQGIVLDLAAHLAWRAGRVR